MFKGAECKRLAIEALHAADRGDIDATVAPADQILSLAGDTRRLARWVAVSGGAVGTSVLTAPEASVDQLTRALRHLESALNALPNVDPDFAIGWHLQLLASRIGICAITGDQKLLSEDLAMLEAVWGRLNSDPVYASSLALLESAMTVFLGFLASAAWGLLAQLRLAEARRILLLTTNWAARSGDMKVELISAVLLASISMLAGDRSAVRNFAQASLDARDRGMRFRTPLPLPTLALLDAMLARVCAWDCMREGDSASAREVLRTTRLRLTPDHMNDVLPAYLLVLSHELQLLLDLGEATDAAAVANSTDVRSLFSGVAGGIVAGPLIRLVEMSDRALAASMVKRLAVQYEWRVPPSLFVEHLGTMALLCAENGDEETAIDCVQRAVDYLTLLGSNQWLASGRSVAVVEHRGLRDQCLEALSKVRSHPVAGPLSRDVMEAWREGSLRELALSPVVPLSGEARRLVTDLNTMLLATTTGDHELEPAAKAGVEKQISLIREGLKHEVGGGYASMLTPRSLERTTFAGDADRILVSACITKEPPNASIVSVTMIPGHAPRLRATPASNEVLEFLRVVRKGFDPVTVSGMKQFEELWQRARRGLSCALGVDLIEDADIESLPVEFLLDEDLRGVPLAALGTSRDQLGSNQTVSFAVSAQDSGRRLSGDSPSTPSVLAFAYDSAPLEVPALRRLESRGMIHLQVVTSLRGLRSALEERSFDVLVISAHGQGAGMEYRFRAQVDDLLHVHDLFGIRIPRTVLAASCYSGTDGESDISGLLATLHAQGAREVLSSLWAIPAKESSELITYILERIPEGQALATLLRGAQARFRDENPGRHDVFWWAGLTSTSVR